MDIRIDREMSAETVGVLETEITQTVEHDFILPDYCPDIFRVLKCCVIPSVTSTGINGGRLGFEVGCIIRVLYRSTEGTGVFTVEHCQEFSKSIELPADTEDPRVMVEPYVEYVNCRVADKRRLDVRAGVLCRICVKGERRRELLKAAYGGGIQLKKQMMTYPAKRLTAAKRITVIEELELASGKPAFGSTIRCSAEVMTGEQKVIPGKLITKGEAQINMLYSPKGGGDSKPESMRFEIPFSQIIDVTGLEEDFDTDVDITAAKCIITPREDGMLECELVLLVSAEAVRYDEAELACDAYSTKCECECERAEVGGRPETIKISTSAACSLSCSDAEIKEVYDMWCEGLSASAGCGEDGKEYVRGKLSFCLLGAGEDGAPIYTERECVYECMIPEQENGRKVGDVKARICGCSYTLSDNGSVQAKAELDIAVKLCEERREVLTSVELLADKPKQCDKRCAVKICFADGDESLWDIAKRYSTSAPAIAEENPDDGDKRRALIIPMKS